MSDERQLVSNKLGNIEDALGEMVNGQRALIEAVRALKPGVELAAAEVERLRAENKALREHPLLMECAELKRFREREEKLQLLLDGIPPAIAALREDGLTRTAGDFEAAYAAVRDFKVTP